MTCLWKLPMTLVLLPVFLVLACLGLLSVVPLALVAGIGFLSGCWSFDPTVVLQRVSYGLLWWHDLGHRKGRRYL